MNWPSGGTRGLQGGAGEARSGLARSEKLSYWVLTGGLPPLPGHTDQRLQPLAVSADWMLVSQHAHSIVSGLATGQGAVHMGKKSDGSC